MKYNFTTFLLIMYLLHTNNLLAAVQTYKLSCLATGKNTSTINCTTSLSLSKTKYTSKVDTDIIPCVCPNDSARVIYYQCGETETSGQWNPVDISNIKNNPNIDSTIQNNLNSGVTAVNNCYACGTGNFLVGTKCYNCATETGYKGATTEEAAVTGIYSCIIPKGDTNEYSDDKGTFKYIAQCAFTCTNNNDALCKSNT